MGIWQTTLESLVRLAPFGTAAEPRVPGNVGSIAVR